MEHGAADDKGGRTAFSARVASLLAALAAFVLYLRTLAPTVLYYDYPGIRDSTALQVKAYLLGIPDVTGYPTYAMLTHLFTYLPFGDPAYRVNLASAVFGAAAVFLFYLVCRRLTGRTSPSLAAALLFALSETFWSQAVIAEVYTLNTLFVAAIVLVLLVWRDERRDLYLLLAAFLMGLSLTHHLTSGLLLPAGLLFVLLMDRSRLLQRRQGMLFGGGGSRIGMHRSPTSVFPGRGFYARLDQNAGCHASLGSSGLPKGARWGNFGGAAMERDETRSVAGSLHGSPGIVDRRVDRRYL